MTTSRRFLALTSLLLAAFAAHAQPAADSIAAPVAPLRAVAWRGFTNAIVLQNEFLRVVIVPEIGRITEFALRDSESPLRADGMLDRGKSTDTNSWANYGGSWLWPAAQDRWAETFGRNWPPPFFDAMPWSVAAWRRDDGALYCRLQQSIGAPMHVRITREFILPKKSAKLFLFQSTQRILDSKMPVTLWNVVQIGHADEVVIPVDAPGLVNLYDQPIAPEHLTACSNAVVIAPRGIEENKVGSASPRSWIAARKGNLLTILRATPGDAGVFPDKGSRVTMYANKGLGYSEIESNSAERNLAPGESLANTVTLELYRAPEKISGDALATWVRQLVGELPFPTDKDSAPPKLESRL